MTEEEKKAVEAKQAEEQKVEAVVSDGTCDPVVVFEVPAGKKISVGAPNLIVLANGRRDLIIDADRVQTPAQTPNAPPAHSATWPRLVQEDSRLTSDGALVLVRLDATGHVDHLAMAQGTMVVAGETRLQLHKAVDYIEIDLSGAAAHVVAGDAEAVKELTINGRKLKVRKDKEKR